jgi:histidyl-tRNA synthetase
MVTSQFRLGMSMALSKKPYKGCRDFFPKEMRIREYIFNKMKEAALSFAFEPYDGPLLEEVELYKAKSGEELINDQIYSFQDRGERFVAIRPEMTPTVARMAAQVHRETPKPNSLVLHSKSHEI